MCGIRVCAEAGWLRVYDYGCGRVGGVDAEKV